MTETSSGTNVQGQRLYNLGLSVEEMDELIEALDFVLEEDSELSGGDEDFIRGLRRKLVAKQRRLKKR